MLRCNAFNYQLENKSTHRLCLDTDMIALSEPNLDLLVDWQAQYCAVGTHKRRIYGYINQ